MSDSFARECVKAFKKSQNVVEICKHAMSQDMVITLSCVSKNFYIIPRNGIDEDEVKMYGEFVYVNLCDGEFGHIDSKSGNNDKAIDWKLWVQSLSRVKSK